MKCLPIRRWVCCGLLLGAGFASAADQVVLAIPARHDLVNLGFDFVSMFPRSMNLVCYNGAGESLSLERYDAAAGRWLPLAPASWAAAAADALVLVGEGAAVSQLRLSAVWAAQASVVSGTRLHEVANAVNGSLRMSPGQWRRLADTYGFTLLDRNADARRFGRYGPPGGRRTPVSRPMPAGATGSAGLASPVDEAPPAAVLSGGPSAQPAAEAPAAEAPGAAVPAAAPPVAPAVVAPADVRPEDK